MIQLESQDFIPGLSFLLPLISTVSTVLCSPLTIRMRREEIYTFKGET